MSENDVLTAVVAAYVVVRLATAGLAHRKAVKAADRKHTQTTARQGDQP